MLPRHTKAYYNTHSTELLSVSKESHQQRLFLTKRIKPFCTLPVWTFNCPQQALITLHKVFNYCWFTHGHREIKRTLGRSRTWVSFRELQPGRVRIENPVQSAPLLKSAQTADKPIGRSETDRVTTGWQDVLNSMNTWSDVSRVVNYRVSFEVTVFISVPKGNVDLTTCSVSLLKSDWCC